MREKPEYSIRIISLWGIILLFSLGIGLAQKVETVEGVRVIHNGKQGVWGKEPEISLQPAGTLGEVDTADANFAFYLPGDIAVDAAGNLYVLDSGNHRVQKFNPEGKYLATFGRQGQGPGEFYFPTSIDVDPDGNIAIADPQNKRIQILTQEGKEKKIVRLVQENFNSIRFARSGMIIMDQTGVFLRLEEEEKKELPRLLKIIDTEGKPIKEIGEPFDYGHLLLNRAGNQVVFTLDENNNIYLAFPF